MNNGSIQGVLLLTYGSATTAEHVPDLLEHIYRTYGKPVPPELITKFKNRYNQIGRSPLLDITAAQAAALEKRLNNEGGRKHFIVRSGMLHSEPFIADALAEVHKASATRVTAIPLTPQFSPAIMGGYVTTLNAAAEDHGYAPENVRIAEEWPIQPHFIECLSKKLLETHTQLEDRYGENIPVVFTTHSLPKRVVEKDTRYLDQLQETIKAIRNATRVKTYEWYAAYQSAGHSPEEWLKPDLTDVLNKLRKQKAPAVLIIPIQFLADHLEVLYDLDIAAAEQCAERDIAYHRIPLPNTDPLFIQALADIVRDNTQKTTL